MRKKVIATTRYETNCNFAYCFNASHVVNRHSGALKSGYAMKTETAYLRMDILLAAQSQQLPANTRDMRKKNKMVSSPII